MTLGRGQVGGGWWAWPPGPSPAGGGFGGGDDGDEVGGGEAQVFAEEGAGDLAAAGAAAQPGFRDAQQCRGLRGGVEAWALIVGLTAFMGGWWCGRR